MRIVTLENSGGMYTSQVYLVLGDASRLEDINTLVGVGQDPAILASLDLAPTGVVKWPVEQVVLTHNHSDHCALLPLVREAYHPRVFAYSPNIDGLDGVLSDGDKIKMGDAVFEVIHTPGHSSDSICLYNEAAGVLFAGDSPLLITSPTGTYEAGFVAALEKLCARDVRRIYFGHGAPLTERCNQRLRESLRMAAGSLPAGGRQICVKNSSPETVRVTQRKEKDNGKTSKRRSARSWRRIDRGCRG
jgi:glyoxylase-like metal-dependent hydrolase (beta-lactamase superfamily II)